jgi:hypothetical protein
MEISKMTVIKALGNNFMADQESESRIHELLHFLDLKELQKFYLIEDMKDEDE